MKALSIRQPWAWLILNAGKDIENRTWKTNFRGKIFVHASMKITNIDIMMAMSKWKTVTQKIGFVDFPVPELLDVGGIVGEVEIVDCVKASNSPWFVGPYGFVLRNPKPLPFRPCRAARIF